MGEVFSGAKAIMSSGMRSSQGRAGAMMAILLLLLLFASSGKALSGKKPAKRTAKATADRLIGRPAPEFELAILGSSGTKAKLSDFRGRAVLLYFWASWVEPCKIEMPWLVGFQEKYGGERLQVLGVSLDNDDEQTKAIEFTLTIGMNFPSLVATEQMASSYGGVDALPETFFIDRNGKIVAHEIGLESQRTIEEHIQRALKGN
jgi:cytochrome c biogenesis protein CcmG/thiol:disulfide interchange protein DsbE